MLFREFIEISEIRDEDSKSPSVKLQKIAGGLTTGTCLTNDGERIYFCDQIGLVRIIENDDTVRKEPFLDITEIIQKLPPSKKGRPSGLDTGYDERGLMGLAFHPNYKRNGRFYIVHADRKKDTKDNDDFNHEQVLCEYTVAKGGNRANARSRKELLRIPKEKQTHNGGDLVFGPDEKLYWGIGDGGCCGDQHGEIGNAQSLASLKGKILRLDVGRKDLIPSDNPFVNVRGARPEIYAYGFRNPWGMSFDGNRHYCAQVGEGEDESGEGWESVFAIKKGGNYGWRIREGTHFFDKPLMKKLGLSSSSFIDPIHEYGHDVGMAVIGGHVYRGSLIPELQGKYVFGDWSSDWDHGTGQLFYLAKSPSGIWRRSSFKYPNGDKSLDYFVTRLGECHNKELYVMAKKDSSPKKNHGIVFRISR